MSERSQDAGRMTDTLFPWWLRLLGHWYAVESYFEVAEYRWWNTWSLNDTGKRLSQRWAEFFPDEEANRR